MTDRWQLVRIFLYNTVPIVSNKMDSLVSPEDGEKDQKVVDAILAYYLKRYAMA